jgi:hypothetical protein
MRLKALEGRSLIAAMCFAQLGSLLPHVAVPSILAEFLIPERHLNGAEAGLLAGLMPRDTWSPCPFSRP